MSIACILSRNQCSIPLLDTNSSRACIQYDGIESGLPAREEPLNAILITVIAIGCTVVTVLFFTGAIAMWSYLCFKARATQRQANRESMTAERNSQVIYESIPEGINGTVVPPNHMESVQHTRNEQQGQETFTPPNNTSSESEFIYINSSVPHTGRVIREETIMNMEQNPSYSSR